ncbi:conserved Plasmodium protein, unknown function [Plasmodium gallinaceum]|uniref:Uncharacterized protein n=1 Tax=Plasmodium gallinaceum TaxID=5849 RepID=A0A1J1GZ29_PLAGA|nr:conserved Plasmodium protein, unknown function [Plasmodium gallinaceum]CRG97489.1 conserved Plasmodium protein, unknown function [Plasmodium gallinaceum]
MEEQIKSYLNDLNFLELCNIIDEKKLEINTVAKCICSNNLIIISKILEKCENYNLKKNILEELDNEIMKNDNIKPFIYIKNYVFLLYKIMLFFDKIKLEENKMLYEIFIIFSLKLIIFYNEKEFLQNILISLIINLDYKKNTYDKLFLGELQKNLYDYYCFIFLSNFIFLNSLLIYLYSNIKYDLDESLKKEIMKQISLTLNNINNFFENLFQKYNHIEEINNYQNSEQSLLMNCSNNDYSFDKECLYDTINKKNIKLIYKKCNFPLLYSYIQYSFNTNKYSLDKEEYDKNYNFKNININNFLLLLKILSPHFLLWVSEKEKQKRENNNPQSMMTKNEEKDCYFFNYVYIINDFENNYLRETSDCFLFFFFSLLSLNEINKNLNEEIDTLMNNVIDNYYTFFEKKYSFLKKNLISFDDLLLKKSEEVSPQKVKETSKLENVEIINESKKTYNEDESLYEKKINSSKLKQETNKSLEFLCKVTSNILLKNSSKIVIKLKSLIIWGYLYFDDVEELNFFNLANAFIFNNNELIYNKSEDINEFLFRKNDFFIYNYRVFKNSYECKTLSFKYMDIFSNYISFFILHIIIILTKTYLNFNFIQPQDEIEYINKGCNKDDEALQMVNNHKNISYLDEIINKKYENKVGNNIQNNTENGTENNMRNDLKYNIRIDIENNIEEEKIKIREDIISNEEKKELNKLCNDIMNSHFYFSVYTNNEKIEFFFNELLFICFKLINFPFKSVQKVCLSSVSLIVSKINIHNYFNYINNKVETLITFIDDKFYDQNEVIKNYINIKCKITKYMNLNFVKSIENLINICFLKLSNRTLCSIIAKNILTCFHYHPFFFSYILYKYLNIIFYLMETNNTNIIINSLKCLFVLFKINSEEMKIYNNDIIYRLHLLFNIFYENELNLCKSNTSKFSKNSLNNYGDNSNNITSFLKNYFFNVTQIEKSKKEMLLHIKLILYCIYSTCSKSEYVKLIHIFSKYPTQFKEYSKQFQVFSAF